jgi:polyhydroxyalkanoate synthesis regulator phasin
MFELLEKAVLTGLGVVSLSQKMAEDFVKEMKDKYKVSEEEGKAFMERMQSMAKDTKGRIAEMAEAEVKKAAERAGLVPKDEFDRLQRRVAELEARLQSNEPGDVT